MDKAKREVSKWITLKNGKHIPIFKDESFNDALKRFGIIKSANNKPDKDAVTLNSDYNSKEMQIKRNKEIADILNSKTASGSQLSSKYEEMSNASKIDPFTRMSRHLSQQGISTEDEIANYLRGLSATRRSKLAREMGIESRGDDKVKEMARRIYLAGKNNDSGELPKKPEATPKVDYGNFSNRIKRIEAFEKKYHVQVERAKFYPYMPSDTFEATFDTIEQHLDTYGIKNFTLFKITMGDPYFDEHPNAMAAMSNSGTLMLNPTYFHMPKKDLDKVMMDCYKNRQFHPEGDMSALIVHELGHARWNKILLNRSLKMAEEKGKSLGGVSASEEIKFASDYFNSMHDISTSTEFNYLEEYRNNKLKGDSLFRNFVEEFENFKEDIRKDPELLEMWYGSDAGKTPYTSRVGLGLRGLVDYDFNGPASISRYAGENIHEMMAEAYADIYYNGSKASFMSKKVMEKFFNIKVK